MHSLLQLCLRGALFSSAVNATLDLVKKAPAGVDFPVTKAPVNLYMRQAGQQACGFKSGDPNQPRFAASGWYCATDTVLNYWGFCPASIPNPADCPIARLCVDSKSCSLGCGRQDFSSTYSCPSNNVCLEDLLLSGAQTFRYFSCGATARANDIYLASPNPSFATPRASSTPASRLASTSDAFTSTSITSSSSNSRVTATNTVQATSTASTESTNVPPVQSSNAASPGREVHVIGAVGSLLFFFLAYV